MPCCHCVSELAFKLLKHHKKLDLLRAFELADKAVQRVEARTVSKEEEEQLGFDPDYSQSCVLGGNCICLMGACVGHEDCYNDSCTCTCPPPLPNSSYVSDTCVSSHSGCQCQIVIPPLRACFDYGCSCGCNGVCYYNCNPPYVWDAGLGQCVLPSAKTLITDGLAGFET